MTDESLQQLTTLSCRMGRAKILLLQGYGTEKAYLKARDAHDAYAKLCVQGETKS